MIDDSLINCGDQHENLEDEISDKEAKIHKKRKDSDVATKANTTNLATMSTPLEEFNSEP